MRHIDRAFQDIKTGIESGLVHKYLLANAADMQNVLRLAQVCYRYNESIFSFALVLSHAMGDPNFINQMINWVEAYQGDKAKILEIMRSAATKEAWNTAESHAQMKAVSSDSCQKNSGFKLDATGGVVAEILDPAFEPMMVELADIIQNWLKKKAPVKEEDLIQAVFDLNLPGLHDSKEGMDHYWILHFCRWVSFVRNKLFDLPIIESERYLDMPGTKNFRAHYPGLEAADMPALYDRFKSFVTDFEIAHGRPDPKATAGDYGCMTCEEGRVLNQVGKNFGCDDDAVRQMLDETMASETERKDWRVYKATHSHPSIGDAKYESARHNSDLFSEFRRSRKRPRPAEKEELNGPSVSSHTCQ